MKPKRILDIGIGSLGRWALLVREFADVWNGGVLPDEWQCTIDGIEGFEPQIHEVQKALYDHIYVGDAFDIIKHLDHYDLIILGDVVEHFTADRARSILLRCIELGSHVLVITPLGSLEEWPQEALYENAWEEHLNIFESQYFLKSKDWTTVAEKSFKDYIGRGFGAFLLRSRHLGPTPVPLPK